MSSIARGASSFDETAKALDLGMLVFDFSHDPDRQCRRLADRVKWAATLLGRATGLQHGKALDAVAQAVRFPAWHHLSAHLAKGFEARRDSLPQTWRDTLSGALLLMVRPEDDVALPLAQIEAYERFGETLAMLTDSPKQRVLDEVSAPLFGGRRWLDVKSRSPLAARKPLYAFVAPRPDDDDDVGGYFDESAACRQLTEALDERLEGFDDLSVAEKRKIRRWLEDVLAAQPGFLEGGLVLASLQFDAGEPEAASTANRFLRQAEALIPAHYKGPIVWAHLGNRFYHRLLWLRLTQHHAAGELPAAAKLARKQLKLNPNDNLGVRHVLPLLLLEQGDFKGADRALRFMDGESGLTASTIKAFVAFALGQPMRFRREFALALFTLPWLRLFLGNTSKGLPEGDDGIRGIHPEIETFDDFIWPACMAVPGLRQACLAFLAEAEIQQAEAELWRYWQGYWGARKTGGTGTRDGWIALMTSWVDRIAIGPGSGVST